MLKRINKVVFLILSLAFLSALIFSLTGCEDEPPTLHEFDFRLPEGFDSLSPEEKLEWAKNNGYFVITLTRGSENEREFYNYNRELLDSFLENKTEEKELLIMEYSNFEENKTASVFFAGIYFDGKYYHATRANSTTAVYHYKICGIERYRDLEVLYVSNDKKLTCGDEMFALTSSVTPSLYSDFLKEYCSIAIIDKE